LKGSKVTILEIYRGTKLRTPKLAAARNITTMLGNISTIGLTLGAILK